jgi:hypothetical protein
MHAWLTKVLAFNTSVTVSPPDPNAILHHVFKKDPFIGSNAEPATHKISKTSISWQIVVVVRALLII